MCMKANTLYQNCGMPLKSDPEKSGSNADGSKTELYCSYCYQDGKFLYEGNKVKEFQEFCRRKMIESGHNQFSAWLFTRGMKRLDRWKN